MGIADTPPLVSPAIVDRIVRAIEAEKWDDLRLGYDRTVFRLNQITPPQMARDARAIRHYNATSRLVYLLAIATGLYGVSPTLESLGVREGSPTDLDAIARVADARRKAGERRG